MTTIYSEENSGSAAQGNVMPDELDKLRELAAQLPRGLRSDWRYSNHYELQCATDEFWWLELHDAVAEAENPCESEEGKRLGLVMDVAAEVGRLKDAGVL